jgi:hypothetical protein
MNEIYYTIADIQTQINSSLSSKELGIEKRYESFFTVPNTVDAHISLLWQKYNSISSPKGELIYAPEPMWHIYYDGIKYYVVFYCSNENMKGNIRAVLCTNVTWNDFLLVENMDNNRLHSVLSTGAGELLLRTNILFNEGLIFHASGIDDNRRGIVFIGHSGAGKSTQLSLWNHNHGVIAINDDRIAVRIVNGEIKCYGTPWGGTSEIASNHSAPLSALILLEQASENEIRLLSPSVSAPMLLARAFLPYWDRELMELAFSILNKLLASVPVYLLRCRPEPEVISLVRSVL